MGLRQSMSRFALVYIVVAVIALAVLPCRSYAMVGDVPTMPTTGQNSQGDSPGGGSPGSTPDVPGSGGPSSTSEPSAFLSGLLGLSLLSAWYGGRSRLARNG